MAKFSVVEESGLQQWESGRALKEHLLSGADRPLVFRRCLVDVWPDVVREWSPAGLSRLLGDRETTFKVCPRRDSSEYRRRFRDTETVFETQCLHVRGTFLDFAEWLESTATSLEQPHVKKPRTEGNASNTNQKAPPNRLLAYPPPEYWIYADYKYMINLCEDHPELLRAIDWSPFGFGGRGGADSTLWAGSDEAYTPCHYDTYGCNLVAQIWGRKKWTLFPPSDSSHLYPTRVPYEESSVFSQVNVACPDLERHPDFASATRCEVVLEAGDVLFVPRQWWHFVECMETSVTVNTWISQDSDALERVKEAVVRATIARWIPAEETVSNTSDSDCDSSEQQSPYNLWINPNEEIFSHQKNLDLLSMTLAECQAPPMEKPRPLISHAPPTEKPHPLISHRDWVNALTSDGVVEAVATTLLERHGRHFRRH